MNLMKRQSSSQLKLFGSTVIQGMHKRMARFQKLLKKCISLHLRAQHTLSAAGTVQVSHALLAVCFSCLLRGRAQLQDGVAAGEGFLCAPFVVCPDLRLQCTKLTHYCTLITSNCLIMFFASGVKCSACLSY
jgi:hypothetical protein